MSLNRKIAVIVRIEQSFLCDCTHTVRPGTVKVTDVQGLLYRLSQNRSKKVKSSRRLSFISGSPGECYECVMRNLKRKNALHPLLKVTQERARERESEKVGTRMNEIVFSHCPLNWANCQPAGSPLAVHFRPENRSIQLVTRLSRVGLRATQIEGCVPLAFPFGSRQPELGTPEPAAL